MRYTASEHYREDPYEEVEAALAAGNAPDRIVTTFEARLSTESRSIPRDAEAIERVQLQLAHLATLAAQVEIAA